MKSNEYKERWINDAMDSTRGMVHASPGPDLFKKITAELANRHPIKTSPFPAKQWVAAAMILLALNVGSVVHFASRHTKTSEPANANPIASAIQAESTYNY